MKVTVTFNPEQAGLLQQYLARSPYRSAEEWLADLVAGVLTPYAMTLPVSGNIKTLLDQRKAVEDSLRAAVKPVAVIEQEATREAS